MAISFSLLFIRSSSSRLLSVRFVMRVHWIMRVFCGGIIMVPIAEFSGRVCVSGLVSFWFMYSVFQFWFSFIWFVAELCCIKSVSARNLTICWNLSWGISSVFAVSSVLCHTLSLNKLSSSSSFVDKTFHSVVKGVFVVVLLIKCWELLSWTKGLVSDMCGLWRFL